MAKPTLHQKDLVIDDVIRETPAITVAQLCDKTGLSEARIQSRVDWDVEKGRALLLGNVVRFNLDKMAKRTVNPFKG